MRGRWFRVVIATSLALVLGSVVGVTGNASAASAGSDATATCTFNGNSLPLIQGVKKGKTIAIQCTGLPALHPYIVLEVSLLAAVNPAAKASLSGGVISPAGLLAALAALPEINLQSAAYPFSDLSGNLTENWTVPKSNPPDPNATCPPSKQQYNSGLLGCAFAMLDLTTAGPVTAGSGLMEYKGFNFLPPAPSMALSTGSASVGQSVSVSDITLKKASKNVYWWLPTLAALDALLGGATGTPTITVTVGTTPADASGISITAASYDGVKFTPPKLSGSFTVPPGVSGPQYVSVAISTVILGFGLANGAQAPLTVS